MTAYGIIAKQGKPDELHADLRTLQWLVEEGLTINRPGPTPILWEALEVRMTPDGWERFDQNSEWS